MNFPEIGLGYDPKIEISKQNLDEFSKRFFPQLFFFSKFRRFCTPYFFIEIELKIEI